MSNRNATSDKAIRQAWSRERDLVLEGKGTRDWTPEEQYDIIRYGKAYDENGKAFEGHHMKSAEMHPEYQGDPDNIQFLTRQEHYDAHGGNFQNETNGYYDPETGITTELGEDEVVPAPVNELSEPIFEEEMTEEGVSYTLKDEYSDIGYRDFDDEEDTGEDSEEELEEDSGDETVDSDEELDSEEDGWDSDDSSGALPEDEEEDEYAYGEEDSGWFSAENGEAPEESDETEETAHFGENEVKSGDVAEEAGNTADASTKQNEDAAPNIDLPEDTEEDDYGIE